jgi:hypothetical protein
VAKTQGGSTLLRSSAPKPPIAATPWTPSVKKNAYSASPSTQHPANQPVDDKKNCSSSEIDFALSHFSQSLSQISDD